MEIKVETTDWANEVFMSAYKLTPLSQLKQYIERRLHLPEMPLSRCRCSGWNSAGRMNKILLKKVEELPLYLIEKDEKVREQDLEISSQKRLLDDLMKRMDITEQKDQKVIMKKLNERQ